MRDFIFLLSLCLSFQASADKLLEAAQNPVAKMISVPFQNNYDFDGADNAYQNTLNIQPVVPFNAKDWTFVTRTIVPIVSRGSDNLDQSSYLGNINFTLFLSPLEASDIIWGLGPSFIFDSCAECRKTSSQETKFGASFVLLSMPGNWVFGGLFTDVKSQNTHSMIVQYFINYNLPDRWYLTSAPLININWKAAADNRYLVPFGLGFGKIVMLGKLPLNLQLAFYTNMIKPTESFYQHQVRFQLQFMFPSF
jgi:hypothetical protein